MDLKTRARYLLIIFNFFFVVSRIKVNPLFKFHFVIYKNRSTEKQTGIHFILRILTIVVQFWRKIRFVPAYWYYNYIGGCQRKSIFQRKSRFSGQQILLCVRFVNYRWGRHISNLVLWLLWRFEGECLHDNNCML